MNVLTWRMDFPPKPPNIQLVRCAVPKDEELFALKESALHSHIIAHKEPISELLCAYPIAKARGL